MKKTLFFFSTLGIVLFSISSFNACKKDKNALNASVVNDTTNFLFEDNSTGVTLTRYKGTATKVTVPSVYINKPVTAIGGYKIGYNSYGAFENTLVESVFIPNSVTSIYFSYYSVFRNCINLSNLRLSDSLKSINAYFDGCTNLKSLTIPSKVTTCYISSDNLQTLRFESTNPPSTWVSIPSTAVIYVPRGSIDKYKKIWEYSISKTNQIIGF